MGARLLSETAIIYCVSVNSPLSSTAVQRGVSSNRHPRKLDSSTCAVCLFSSDSRARCQRQHRQPPCPLAHHTPRRARPPSRRRSRVQTNSRAFRCRGVAFRWIFSGFGGFNCLVEGFFFCLGAWRNRFGMCTGIVARHIAVQYDSQSVVCCRIRILPYNQYIVQYWTVQYSTVSERLKMDPDRHYLSYRGQFEPEATLQTLKDKNKKRNVWISQGSSLLLICL